MHFLSRIARMQSLMSHLHMHIICQRRPAVRRAFIHMVEGVPRQGRLEGCHRMPAATHLICELDCVQCITE